jgi:hypothetical protein
MANLSDAYNDPVRRAIGIDTGTSPSTVVEDTSPYTGPGFGTVNYAGAISVDGGLAPAVSAIPQGPIAIGSTPLSSVSNFTATPQNKNTPVYGANGAIIGYNVTSYNWDGSILSNQYVPTAAATGPTGSISSSQQTRQNAFDAAIAQMKTWGLLKTDANGNLDAASQALSDQIKNLAFTDAGADTISLALQNSDAYKARFSGNEARKAAGLAVLSPAEYIATENAYTQVLRNAGVPSGFYSTTAQMAKLIGADVSATELQGRIDLAKQSIANADPYYTQTLQNFYGLSSGDMIAHVLDPSVAMPLLQQQASSTAIGTEAARQATNISLTYAQQLAAMGVTQAQAAQGFQSIAQQLPATQALASRYSGYTPMGAVGQELQAATFGSPTQTTGETAAQAEQRLRKLQTAETSQFGGSAGANEQAQSLGIGTAQGVS